MSSSSTALLESQKLLSTESLVVDLRRGLNKVLEMGSSKEVPEIHEFAVVLIFDIDDPPSILTATNLLSSDDD